MKNLVYAILKNWKTTSAAIGMLLVALGPAVQALIDGDPSTSPNYNIVIPEVLAAIALLMARDADKSSQDSGVRN
tara:strand:- start:1190 stop:1414 length:225 start_codon:yes stop_codon:yes gene_type:complete